MKTTLFTIGYAAHSPDSLFSRLKSKGIERLIDVRELPLSRKKGFSKSALAATAAANSIEYRHIKELGVPSVMRHQIRKGGIDRSDYMNSFRDLLRSRRDVLHETLQLVESKPSCLLCLEADPVDCHRTVVAEELAMLAPDSLVVEDI